jgi:hypothetical protein
MSARRLLVLLAAATAMGVSASHAHAAATGSVAPAFLPMPIPELLATAASPDPESAGQALSWLFAIGSSTDHALLRLLSVGTTQDRRIALHIADQPDPAAIPALLSALQNHDDGTSTADAVAHALRASVPLEFGPPPPFIGVDGRTEEDSRAWRDWGRRHRRTQTAACLGRSSLSVFPLAVMLLSGRGRRRD